VILIALTYTRLPWRSLQPKPADADEPPGRVVIVAAPAPDAPRSTAAPDAYADYT
jgi:alpha-1,6-mannosyltransferase